MSRLDDIVENGKVADNLYIMDDSWEVVKVKRMSIKNDVDYTIDSPYEYSTIKAKIFRSGRSKIFFMAGNARISRGMFHAITDSQVKRGDTWNARGKQFSVESIESIIGMFTRVELMSLD
jgi:hypothetical protein